MSTELPSAVPEIPVTDMDKALRYYEEKLGFTVDWGRDGGESRVFHRAAAEFSSPTASFVSIFRTRRQL